MKSSLIVKRIFIGLGALLLVVLLLAVSIPFFFKDKIIAEVKSAINNNVNAKVNFKDVSISAFKHFPSITVGLTDLDVEGLGEFEGVKLLHANSADASVDFWSVVGGGKPYKVNSIHLEKPYLNIIMLSDGVANYAVSKSPAAATSQPSGFVLNLDQYSVSDGEIIFDNRGMGFYMDLNHVNHTGSGALAADIFDLKTKTTADALTVKYGAVSYLSDAKANLDAVLNMDLNQMKFTFKDNQALVNTMPLKVDGWLQMAKDGDKTMDLKFSAPSSDFKNLLSVIPAAYTKNFENVNATGKFDFNGFAKGTYSSLKKLLPAFAIHANVQNGAFKYPSLPLGVTDVNTQFSVESPTSNYDDVKIDVPAFHMKLGANPFDAVFHLKTPISDPDVDAKVNGVLNLDDLSKAFPFESVSKLTGTITANVAAKTRASLIEQKKYDQVNMNGAMQINNMNLAMKNYPPVRINALQMNFTPNNVGLNNFDARLGKSDIRGSGTIDNILAYFSPKKTMTGTLNFSSHLFDANEWMKPAPETADKSAAVKGKNPTDHAKPFDRFNFTLNGKMDQLVYSKYNITSIVAKGNFTPNKFIFSDFGAQIGNSDLHGKGVINNAFNYMFDNQTLSGQMDLTSNLMDLNQFMTPAPKTAAANPTAATVPAAATQPIEIPKNIDVTITAKVNKALYTNMDLNALKGSLVVHNQQVVIENATANTLGGNVALKGGYNTENAAKPEFKLNFDFNNIDFKQSFSTFVTAQKLAPILQFITGKFNTSMSMSGALGKDLMPDFNTLNMDGFLQTIQGFVSGFKPLELMADKLNLPELKKIDLSQTKNWIQVKNGTVIVQEFDRKVKDIALKISGSHSLSNEMNYIVKARVPRKLIQQNPLGQAAGTAYDDLLKLANKNGLNLQNSEFVNVQFDITGSMLAPKLGLKILGGDGQSSVEDAVKTQANAVLQKAKDSVTTRAQQEVDKAKAKAEKAIDSLTASAKSKVGDEIKKQAGDILSKQVGGSGGAAPSGSQLPNAAADALKKQAGSILDNFDPFGKKKTTPKKDTTGH